MWRGISLANKCLLLFGGAVILIVLLALSVPWLRMDALVDEGQLELSRRLAEVWKTLDDQAGEGRDAEAAADPEGLEHGGIRARLLPVARAEAEGAEDPFIARALRVFRRDAQRQDLQTATWSIAARQYRYARALRGPDQALEGLILIQRRPFAATRLSIINTAYVLGAGFVVLGLAVLVFYLITHQLILSPVRELKQTAERVREGDLSIRSAITTGDEFEELSETFNAMLAELVRSHDQLRAINRAMDVKLSELSEANTALYEAARLKGEFLANVSHELRTPLNSIIGFAELLLEIARAEADAGDDSTRLSKRIRFLENIVSAGRGLLDMINDLLEMARIEAGKAELKPERVNLREVCEGLVGLIAPQSQKKGLDLTLEVAEDVPLLETDLKKFQHIVFNFLSNAVKFTPSVDRDGRAGRVTLRAERLVGRGGPEVAGGGDGGEERIRVSVIDTGPGIAPADQQRIFEKFQQLDGSHTREHAGTGLGLAISRELAGMLQAEIQLVSEPGRGSMFSLILPLRLDPGRAAETRLEAAFRGTLAGRRAWV